MKIYTRNGDEGETSLAGGTRVSKSHPRVETYGDVDELISCIGLIRCGVDEDGTVLRRIQDRLMYVSAIFASPTESARLQRIEEADIIFLESEIDRLTASMPPQKAFVVPGAPRESSLCHLARCICRRAERHGVAIEGKTSSDKMALRYLNRLSDYLFTLARHLCVACGFEEDYWMTGK